MKFSIKNFFLVIFTEEILNEKFYFLCSVCEAIQKNFIFSIVNLKTSYISETNKDTPIDYSANIYLLKVNKNNFRKRCEICSKLIIKTPA